MQIALVLSEAVLVLLLDLAALPWPVIDFHCDASHSLHSVEYDHEYESNPRRSTAQPATAAGIFPIMHPADLSDDDLLAACDVTRQRRSGPGGQHRNKVETAVVILHRPTALTGQASERRSQEENRRVALFRLRLLLAVEHRTVREAKSPPSSLWVSRIRGGRIAVSSRHADFPPLLAEAIDVLSGCDWQLPLAAQRLQVTSSQLLKFLARHPPALVVLNRRRQSLHLPPLRSN